MSSRSENPSLTATIVVPDAPADVAAIRSQKLSLLAQLRTQSDAVNAPTPEELLGQWPTNPRVDRDAASLIFQDFCQRREQDPESKLENYQERFPEHRDALASLLQQDALLKSMSGSSGSSPHFALPEVGDRLFGFRLLSELGRGSFARVFLAAQENLARRPVVLKVSNMDGEEPQTMAMLQHTHIVPIYSVHEDQRAGLRAVCMPFFGGASLSAVLKKAGVGSIPVHTGQELVSALQAVAAPLPKGLPESSLDAHGDAKVLTLLQSYSYPQAAAWIVARLAEGLQHSHSRGVLHRDIKPSNVLLGSDGQPMLLDFNLAQVTRGEQVRVVLGGTINYMAPEHLRSLASRDPIVARQVDHRADIYSLGMVLFEMLVGRGPFAESASYTPLPLLVEAMAVERGRAAPSLRKSLPNAPWNLESIIRKCLAPQPADRYAKAEHLADDLQRFLEDRPLRYASELSLRERCRKWSRRHPRLSAAGAVALVAGLLLSTLAAALIGSQQLLAITQDDLSLTREHLDRARAHDNKRAFQAGTVRALCLVNTTTDGQDQLRAGREACEQTLAIFNILQRDDWQSQPGWQYLEESERRQLAEDARELLLLLAWARVTSTPGSSSTLHDALALLDRCEAITGLPPLQALWHDRAVYLGCLGKDDQAQVAKDKASQLVPASARDHYLLALSFARQGQYPPAIAELNAALGMNPNHYWSLVQRGICYRELGELLLAAGDFSRCTGVEPNSAWGHYNLGCILDQSQKREQAISSYSAAVRCDKSFALAYLNRGLARLDLKQASLALSDLDQAMDLGREDAILHLGRGTALQELNRSEQSEAAFTLALQRALTLPSAKRTSLQLRYGFSVYKRLPQSAMNAFDDVLRREPHHPQALYGKAMIHVEQNNTDAAIACFDQALAQQASFVDARRFRAVLFARKGKLEEAQADINHCLQQEPQAGISLYAAACVLARAAERNQDGGIRRQFEDQALTFLGKALASNYGRDSAAHDPDLQALHQRPEFRNLLR